MLKLAYRPAIKVDLAGRLRVNLLRFQMSDKIPFHKKILQSLQARLVEGIAGTLWLLCAGFVQTFGDRIVHSVNNALGIQVLLQIGTLLLISSGYFCLKFFQIRKRLKHKPAKEKTVFVAGIEFRKGPRTVGDWLPFCPKCHTPLHPEKFCFPIECPSRCGWHSTISQLQIVELMEQSESCD